MKIYFVSGLGSNRYAFERLNIPSGFESVFIDWKIPEKQESLPHYAERMAADINTNEPFILLGYSFGGIMVQEMNRIVSPQKTILLSSVKNRKELPPIMRFASHSHAYKAIPVWFITSDKVVSYAFFRTLYNPKLPSLEKYFDFKDPYYLKWSINQIVNWHPQNKPIENLYHIHGDTDFVFPAKYIKNYIPVKGGTHLMAIQKAKGVSSAIKHCLFA